MAINIKELFNADADNIKVDKINYNFDQILANGGGPAGIKGDQGTTGNTGTKGQKGEVGSKGSVGNKGEQGTSANLWDSDTISVLAGDVDILRPFNNSTDDLRTRLILGQDTSTSNNTVPNEEAGLLNLVLPPVANDDTTSQIIFTNDEPGDPREFKMATSYEQGTGTTFTFSALAATAGEKTNLIFQIPNDVEINATDKVEITSPSLVKIGDLANVQTVDVLALEELNLEAADKIETNAAIVNINGTVVDVSGSDIDIVAISGTIDIVSPANTITSTGNNVMSAPINTLSGSSSGPTNIISTTATGGQNVLRNSGVNSFVTATGLNTSDQTIFFSNSGGDHDGNTDEGINPSEVSSGDGIRFKEGAASSGGVALNTTDPGYYGAPNNGSDVVSRTLSDYFYEDSVTSVGGGIYYADNFAAGGGGNGAWNTLDVKGLINPSSHNREYSYVKIGNVVHVWGEVNIDISSGSQATVWAGETDPLLILLNDPTGSQSFRFPYVNASNSYVDVNVKIRQNSETAGQSGGDANYFTTTGRIKPGDNRIVLWKYGLFETISSAKWHFLKFSPSELYDGTAGGEFTISYNFSMPVNWNSYNRVFEAGIGASGEGESSVETSGSGSGETSGSGSGSGETSGSGSGSGETLTSGSGSGETLTSGSGSGETLTSGSGSGSGETSGSGSGSGA